MPTCPNKNSIDWTNMVAKTGEETAYEIFTLNNEVVPTLGIAPNGNPSILYEKLKKHTAIADTLWYASKTAIYVNNPDLKRDTNGEIDINELLGEQGTKYSEYTSSIDQRVNNVINAADEFIKKTAVNLANRSLHYPSVGQLATAVDDLKKLGIQESIVDMDLSNLANALKTLLEYNHTTLLATIKKKNSGGILPRLEFYEVQDMDAIVNNNEERLEFTKFMRCASIFLKGYANITKLKSIQEGDFAEQEDVIRCNFSRNE